MMATNRPLGFVGAVVASAVVPVVAAAVVFVDPTPRELLQAAVLGWLPLAVAVGTADVNPARLSRFAIVFCGTLVGLTLLVATLLGQPVLDIGLYRVSSLQFAVPINPVMAVLVGGAAALSYYGVFEWGPEASDGTAV
ncbi:hypothetical protein [Natronomonas amylolytica]|uniref:hypothetical protein n=1 Tax=Natronomonas amylolytica TaxID=3108498 RepID=UPI00300B10A9